MYDTFSSDYDRFVHWAGRLEFEMPFILQLLPPACRVLDAACGTGMHAIELARQGYSVSAADLSTKMIERARENAAAAGQQVEFKAAGFGELARAFAPTPGFDALLCLGNSIPHLLTRDSLRAALADFAANLRPGGVLLVQNRNFDAALQQRARWIEPQAHQEGSAEWVFLRMVDYLADDRIQFNILTLKREDPQAAWQQSVQSTLLYPWRQIELIAQLRQAGFNQIHSYGDMQGTAFDPTASGNLILSAVR
jgi:glycine/sarcosine N-methyltransferase